MKKTILLISVLVLSLGLNYCNSCDGENPRVTLQNGATTNASVQVQTSGGNTINVNNIAPGTSSTQQSFAPGTITFTITIQGGATYTHTLNSTTCYDYVININNNAATTEAVDRNA
ncbi:MAG: hypothetical protein OEZ36_13640 [Spirochaetota bacterium]|nr:hypothetical protein [Spirochaetota bacterium]